MIFVPIFVNWNTDFGFTTWTFHILWALFGKVCIKFVGF
jgi:hypothetical protein